MPNGNYPENQDNFVLYSCGLFFNPLLYSNGIMFLDTLPYGGLKMNFSTIFQVYQISISITLMRIADGFGGDINSTKYGLV